MTTLRFVFSTLALSMAMPAFAAPTVRACAAGDDVHPSLIGAGFTHTLTAVAPTQFAVSFPWTVGRTQAYIYNDRFNPRNYIVASAVGIAGVGRCAVVEEGAPGEVLFLSLRMTGAADTVTLRHPVTGGGLAPTNTVTALIAAVATARGADTINGSTTSSSSYGEILVGGSEADILYGSGSDDCLIGGAKATAAFLPYSGVAGPNGPMWEYMNVNCVPADDGGLIDGIDAIYAGDGDDFAFGCESDDQIWLGNGNDVGHGDLGGLLMTFVTDDDVIEGEAGSDFIGDDNGDNIVHGGSGADIISLGAGDDEAVGDDPTDPPSVDQIFMGDGANFAWGGPGDDEIHGGAEVDVFEGGDGGDQLYGEGGDDVLRGGPGDDYVRGGAGTDEIRGEDGLDILYGDEDPDALLGGPGDDDLYGGMDDWDYLAGESGSDMLCDGNGADEYRGGTGNDLLFHALASGVDPVTLVASVAAEAPVWSEAGIPGDFDLCSNFIVPAGINYWFGWSAGSTCNNWLTFDETSPDFCQR